MELGLAHDSWDIHYKWKVNVDTEGKQHCINMFTPMYNQINIKKGQCLGKKCWESSLIRRICVYVLSRFSRV